MCAATLRSFSAFCKFDGKFTTMFHRTALLRLRWLLQRFPAVALLGPRQAGKTTLALSHQEATPGALYLDLELPSARRQRDDPEAFLLAQCPT